MSATLLRAAVVGGVPFVEADYWQALKKVLPTNLGTADLQDNLASEFRDRATVLAQVGNAHYLDEVNKVVQDIISGNSTTAEARLRLKTVADAIGLETPIPTGNTLIDEMLDMRSDRRLNLVIDTAVANAYGYGQLLASQDPDLLQEYPAWRLTRWEERKEPRQWDERWMTAAAGTPEDGRNDDEYIALKSHEIWDNLGDSSLFDDALDTSYPPFAFNSGMGVEEINRDEAISVGVIDERAEEPQRDIPGFNDTFELSGDFLSGDLLDALLNSNRNLEVKDGVLTLKGAA